MADSENVVVTRETFPMEMLPSFQQMYLNGLYSDLTIVSQDNIPFPVHKLVVCASTEMFTAAIGSMGISMQQLVFY